MARKKALVTGGAGFVGRHFTRRLLDDGWDVISVDVREVPMNRNMTHPVGSAQLHLIQDMRQFVTPWNPSYPTTRYDLVIHGAYHVGGRAAIDGTNMNLAGNVWLDAMLFEWAVRTHQPRVLYFSSSAAYPASAQSQLARPHRLHEDDVHLDCPHRLVGVPDGDYGWAKLNGERLAAATQRNGVRVHIVRPFSGYGNDQDLTYPFPAIVQRVNDHVAGEPFTVWGPPGQTRDWIHIDDVVAGALAVVESDEIRPVNLCTGRGTSFGELVHLAFAAAGRSGHLGEIIYDTTRPTGVFRRVGDPCRMRERYVPTVSIQEGLYRAFNR